MTTIERFVKKFKSEFRKQVRGIWGVEFVLRSQPLHAWIGKWAPAIHIHDINGDLQFIVRVAPADVIDGNVGVAVESLLRQW